MAHLTRERRYTISVMLKTGHSRKEILAAIGKDKSVLRRELKRNRNERGNYIFKDAQELRDIRKQRLKNKRKFTTEVRNRIERYIGKQWSPEQIVGYCKNKGYAMVCVERIYQYIREDKKSGGNLWEQCRFQLKHRARPATKGSPIKDRISIDERPKEADGSRMGDWEMDTIVGKGGKGAILTLVERKTSFTMIRKLPHGKDSKELVKILVQMLYPYIKNIKSITTDNGPEFAAHKEISKNLKT